MSLLRDRQTKHYCLYLLLTLFLCALFCLALSLRMNHIMKISLLEHDEAILSYLLNQGVPEAVAAGAITSGPVSPGGMTSGPVSSGAGELMGRIGLTVHVSSRYLPALSAPLTALNQSLLLLLSVMTLLLSGGTLVFFTCREHLYQQAVMAVNRFIAGDYSVHLPRTEEGTLHLLFSSVDSLATALQSKNETEHQIKEFLKATISDISHQLKTPLAAMAMYSEIIADESDNPDTVAAFSGKMRQSLSRMEQLIGSLLKITRLDAGNITFAQQPHPVRELAELAVRDLSVRAALERKELTLEGGENTVICDLSWTAEALGNLVKNALDHTAAGGSIRIFWESSPVMVRILISDDGSGIAPEDIHHIFKRFYRSRQPKDTQGAGLGLPLAKSIIEQQGGILTVQSTPGVETTFTLSFLTKL